MTIIIKEINGTELVNEEFSMLDVSGKNFSITFKALNIVANASLDPEKIYNVTFVDSEKLGLTGTIIMSYLTYNYSASTAFMTNELGEQVPTIQVNANSLQLRRY